MRQLEAQENKRRQEAETLKTQPEREHLYSCCGQELMQLAPKDELPGPDPGRVAHFQGFRALIQEILRDLQSEPSGSKAWFMLDLGGFVGESGLGSRFKV